jgi:hypothetical protein
LAGNGQEADGLLKAARPHGHDQINSTSAFSWARKTAPLAVNCEAEIASVLLGPGKPGTGLTIRYCPYAVSIQS